jgi:hypothetical protein
LNSEVIKRIQDIKDPVEKLLHFMAVLNKELKKKDVSVKPIVVGGSAVLVYSLGGHLTQDIDVIISDRHRQLVKDVLSQFGFENTAGQRHWYHEELDLALEMPGDILAGSMDKAITVEVGDSEVYLIGIEDILIDRLCAAKHWKYDRDEAQAISLLSIYMNKIDWDYLVKRAKEEMVQDKLEEAKKKAETIVQKLTD